jgi:NADPH-dependent 2,4-dienoyl-CoA reductase/sulfur reductase-like enzyme
VGREKRLGIGTLEPAAVPRKVIVVGGGPSGMKVAEIATLRGHRVVLYEKEESLGGQVKLASSIPLRQEFGEVARYLENRLKKLGVETRLGQEANEETIQTEQPDAVVIAAGCQPIRTLFLTDKLSEVTIPGVDQDNVMSVWDVLRDKEKAGKKVVVVVNTDMHPRNLAVADYLAADKERKVEIITSTRSVFPQRIHPFETSALARRIREQGIVTRLSTQVKEISGDRLVLVNGDEIDGVDTIIWATGAKPNDSLYFKLKGKVKELYRIGDCVAPRWVDFAIWEGEMLGRNL